MAIHFYRNQVTHKCFNITKYIKKYKIIATNALSDVDDNNFLANNTQNTLCTLHHMIDNQDNMKNKHSDAINYLHFEKIKNDLLNTLNKKDYKIFLQKVTDLALPSLEKSSYDFYSHTPYKNDVSGEFNIDYVNASFIPLHDGKRFIAAQAPKKEYIQRFDKLIQESKCNLIVCLANMENEGIGEYLNTKNQESQENINKYQRIVCNNWLDMKNPNNDTLETIYKEFESHYVICSKDIIIHCKAGLGRTGVFILHHILKTLKVTNNEDFLTIFLYLRCKRNYLVYTEKQLKHIHESYIKDSETTSIIRYVNIEKAYR